MIDDLLPATLSICVLLSPFEAVVMISDTRGVADLGQENTGRQSLLAFVSAPVNKFSSAGTPLRNRGSVWVGFPTLDASTPADPAATDFRWATQSAA